MKLPTPTRDTQMGSKSKQARNIVNNVNVMAARGFYAQCRLDFAVLKCPDNHVTAQSAAG